jgi:hypothetical protein
MGWNRRPKIPINPMPVRRQPSGSKQLYWLSNNKNYMTGSSEFSNLQYGVVGFNESMFPSMILLAI